MMINFVISHRHKAIITAQTPQLLNITGAKPFTYNNQPFTFIPHNLANVYTLKCNGIHAPSPILSQYTWDGPKTPFDSQYGTSAFMTMNPRAFVLNEIGTGKTLAALWALDYLLRQGFITSVLIVAPLSTLRRVWADEIFKSFPHRSFGILHGSIEKRLRILNEHHDFYIINHDGIAVIEDELIQTRHGRAVVIDEISLFKNRNAERWKIMWRILYDVYWAWGLTGSLIPEASSNAYAPGRLILPHKINRSFTAFRERVEWKLDDYTYVSRPGAADYIFRMLQPAVRYKRSECFDLPPMIYMDREAEMSKPQQRAYKEMNNKLLVEYHAGQITAANAGVKAFKLLQIAGGVVYDDEKNLVYLDVKPRLKLLLEAIHESHAKVLIFAPLRGAVRMIAKFLSSTYNVAIIDGTVSATKRDGIFYAFENNPHPHIIVAHPRTMSHGLTLVAADTVIWYLPPPSAETYEQANGRISRTGQSRDQLIFHLQSTAIERRIYSKLRHKLSTQSVLLEMYAQNTNLL